MVKGFGRLKLREQLKATIRFLLQAKPLHFNRTLALSAMLADPPPCQAAQSKEEAFGTPSLLWKRV